MKAKNPSDLYAWRPRLEREELRILDAALTGYLDNWEGAWTGDAVLATVLLERVRNARVHVERNPQKRISILEGRR